MNLICIYIYIYIIHPALNNVLRGGSPLKTPLLSTFPKRSSPPSRVFSTFLCQRACFRKKGPPPPQGFSVHFYVNVPVFEKQKIKMPKMAASQPFLTFWFFVFHLFLQVWQPSPAIRARDTWPEEITGQPTGQAGYRATGSNKPTGQPDQPGKKGLPGNLVHILCQRACFWKTKNQNAKNGSLRCHFWHFDFLFFMGFAGPAAWPGQPKTGWPAQPGTNRANPTNRLTGYPTGDGLSPLARETLLDCVPFIIPFLKMTSWSSCDHTHCDIDQSGEAAPALDLPLARGIGSQAQRSICRLSLFMDYTAEP